MTESNGTAAATSKSRIDRRIVVYPVLFGSLGLLAWMVIAGVEGKLRESVADGLVNVILLIVVGVLAFRSVERVADAVLAKRLGAAPPPPPSQPGSVP